MYNYDIVIPRKERQKIHDYEEIVTSVPHRTKADGVDRQPGEACWNSLDTSNARPIVEAMFEERPMSSDGRLSAYMIMMNLWKSRKIDT